MPLRFLRERLNTRATTQEAAATRASRGTIGQRSRNRVTTKTARAEARLVKNVTWRARATQGSSTRSGSTTLEFSVMQPPSGPELILERSRFNHAEIRLPCGARGEVSFSRAIVEIESVR